MEHFVCGVLATYGLVVACGNMETPEEEDGEQSCLSKLYKKNTPNGSILRVVENETEEK